jgi:hypothetical protein
VAKHIAQVVAAHMRLDAEDPIAFCGGRRLDFSVSSYFLWPAFGDALYLRRVNAIWQLFVVLPLSVNASRIGEQFFEFLERIWPLAFYSPQLSINMAAKFRRSSAYRLWF